MRWHCHDRYHRMPQGAVAGGIAVVIDVLRASTTIATALANGAARIRPVPAVDAARALAAALGPGTLLGGERGGTRIGGFDLGNSPLEYSRDRVAGRSIVVTTTNGTAAIDACEDAREVLLGAIVNRSATAALARSLALRHGVGDVHLVCAGTDGAVTEEDVLAAGAILDAAARLPGADGDAIDAAGGDALAGYRDAVAVGPTVGDAIARAFARSLGGRNLLDLGMDADLPAAAAIDSLVVVPLLDRATGWLHAA
jgi:2-phosphosulfolactate phosphatase